MKYFFALFVLFSACGWPTPLTPEQRALREQKLRELLRHGNAELQAGDWDSLDRAQGAYSVARELSPEDPRVIDGLGCVAWRKGNAELAELYFKRAVELSPVYDRPLAHLAAVAESRGHQQAAAELLLKALALNPLNFRARNNFAAVLINTSAKGPPLAEAQRELLKAYELAGPEDPIVSGNLAILNGRTGW